MPDASVEITAKSKGRFGLWMGRNWVLLFLLLEFIAFSALGTRFLTLENLQNIFVAATVVLLLGAPHPVACGDLGLGEDARKVDVACLVVLHGLPLVLVELVLILAPVRGAGLSKGNGPLTRRSFYDEMSILICPFGALMAGSGPSRRHG